MNDIEVLEERVITLRRHIKNYEESDCKTNIYQQLVKECQAIENLLKERQSDKERIEELEENNQQLEKWLNYYKLGNTVKEFEELFGNTPLNEIEKIKIYIFQNYTPKTLIKEKIEELKKQEKEELKGMKGQDRYFVKQIYQYKIQVLEELLKGE